MHCPHSSFLSQLSPTSLRATTWETFYETEETEAFVEGVPAANEMALWEGSQDLVGFERLDFFKEGAVQDCVYDNRVGKVQLMPEIVSANSFKIEECCLFQVVIIAAFVLINLYQPSRPLSLRFVVFKNMESSNGFCLTTFNPTR